MESSNEQPVNMSDTPYLTLVMILVVAEIPIIALLFMVGPAAALIGGMLAGALAQGAVAVAMGQSILGRPTGVWVGYRGVFSRLGTYLATIVLQILAILVGFILLIIPGVYLSVKFAFAPAACLLEQLGPVDALRRSSQLTDGLFATIFGASFLFGIGNNIVGAIGSAATASSGDDLTGNIVAVTIYGILFGPLLQSFFVRKYYEARFAGEFNVDDLASELDAVGSPRGPATGIDL